MPCHTFLCYGHCSGIVVKELSAPSIGAFLLPSAWSISFHQERERKGSEAHTGFLQQLSQAGIWSILPPPMTGGLSQDFVLWLSKLYPKGRNVLSSDKDSFAVSHPRPCPAVHRSEARHTGGFVTRSDLREARLLPQGPSDLGGCEPEKPNS